MGVSKLPEWLQVTERPGIISAQQTPRSRTRGQTVHTDDTGGWRLAEELLVGAGGDHGPRVICLQMHRCAWTPAVTITSSRGISGALR